MFVYRCRLGVELRVLKRKGKEKSPMDGNERIRRRKRQEIGKCCPSEFAAWLQYGMGPWLQGGFQGKQKRIVDLFLAFASSRQLSGKE